MDAEKLSLFISHATDDESIVKLFMQLVESGIGIDPRAIFCSSRKGQGIPPGVGFVEYIRSSLNGSSCVVALLSENFYSSTFCVCELGGVWVSAKSLIPIIVPPLDFSSMKAVLQGVQALKLGDPCDLDMLRDECASRLGVKPLPTPRWNEERDRFLAELKSALAKVTSKAPVPRAAHEKKCKELDEYRTQYEQQSLEIQKLKEKCDALEKVKDRQAVAKILQKFSTKPQQFEALAADCHRTLQSLERVVREAIYYDFRGEEYRPECDDSKDAAAAGEEGYLIIDSESGVVQPDTGAQGVKSAVAALNAMKTWLARNADGEFERWYAAEYPDSRPDVCLRPFWREHF